MGWGDSRRIRRSVHRANDHLGYVTTISYPDRDLTAFSEGSPYREVVIADPAEEHVSLLQRYKEHWLIQCGGCYGTTDRPEELDDAQAMQLALFALAHANDPGPVLVGLLKEWLDALLAGSGKA
jgi:hypothetical protein